VHTDDTGWRVGGAPAFLMAFVSRSLSVYQVRPQHRNEEVRESSPSIRRCHGLRPGPELRCRGTGRGGAAEMPVDHWHSLMATLSRIS